jgi:predicted metal-dependent phosphoesterase TrpH
MNAEEAVALVHELGGLAFLAHPGLENAERHCEALLGMGIDGVETYHPDNSDQVTARMNAWTEEHGLLISGGSDFHEANGAHMVGRPRVPEEVYDRIRERINR